MYSPLSLLFLLLLSLSSKSHSQPQQPPNDAASLLSFKSKADLDNKLLFTLNEHFDYCHWQGVKCQQARVVRFSLPNFSLRGTFPPNSLTSLTQLRVLVLNNNSLSGPLPLHLNSLTNLRSLLIHNNLFSYSLPPSLFSLYKLRVLNLAFNNFSGILSPDFILLDRLTSLNLQFNSFHGGIPRFNQSGLRFFNVSGNNFSGKISDTVTLSRFSPSSFVLNPGLCGEIVNKPCDSLSPFFDSSSTTTGKPSSSSSNESGSLLSPPLTKSHRRKTKVIVLGFSLGGVLLILSLLFMIFAVKKKTTSSSRRRENVSDVASSGNSHTTEQGEIRVRLNSHSHELKEKCKQVVEEGGGGKVRREKSGNLVFCGGEVNLYTLEHLMRGSAEMLGRGTMGTTYKAKLDNQLIVTVKRLDAMKMSGVNGEIFERIMEIVGGMRHPNLVPVRAYFQAKEERLIIFDYQPNGSVFNLIHGSRSTRAKPLHWTSCLKIAEDVAQGLAYIHQASKLIHGNLKASNVLLGTDFEACITDYCIAALSTSSYDTEDPDSARYVGPEARNSSRMATPKTDVYAFGVLLLELLSGKPPSQHPFLAPHDMLKWVKTMRGDGDSFEDNHLAMLVEVATLCSLTSPEQRPPMWQVLKMIQKIKASVGSDNDAINPTTGYS